MGVYWDDKWILMGLQWSIMGYSGYLMVRSPFLKPTNYVLGPGD